MRQYRHFLFLSPPPLTMNLQGASTMRTRVMDSNRGRHCTALTYWKCKISWMHLCRWLPKYTLAVHITCRLAASATVQRHEVPYCYLISPLCKLYASQAHLCSLYMGYLVQPTFMSAGISNSTNHKDWDIVLLLWSSIWISNSSLWKWKQVTPCDYTELTRQILASP